MKKKPIVLKCSLKNIIFVMNISYARIEFQPHIKRLQEEPRYLSKCTYCLIFKNIQYTSDTL